MTDAQASGAAQDADESGRRTIAAPIRRDRWRDPDEDDIDYEDENPLFGLD